MFLGMPLVFLGAIHTGGPGSGNMPLWMLYGMLILFSGVGLVLLAYTVPLTLSALRFGRVPLRLKTWPARIVGYVDRARPPFRKANTYYVVTAGLLDQYSFK